MSLGDRQYIVAELTVKVIYLLFKAESTFGLTTLNTNVHLFKNELA
jgi:hypothetical protein